MCVSTVGFLTLNPTAGRFARPLPGRTGPLRLPDTEACSHIASISRRLLCVLPESSLAPRERTWGGAGSPTLVSVSKPQGLDKSPGHLGRGERGASGRPRWYLEACSPHEGNQEPGIHPPPPIISAVLFPKVNNILDKLFSSTWDTGFCKSGIGFQNKTKKALPVLLLRVAALVSILVGVKVNYHVVYCPLHTLRKSW